MTTLNTAPISLENAKKLVALIESGNNQQAHELLESCSAHSSAELFAEVGKLTRQLHDSLNTFQFEPRIINLANEEIPDAQTRLNYVIEATEEAANKTMDLVDSCMPIAERLHDGVNNILPEWNKLFARELQTGEFNSLARDMDGLLKTGSEDTAKLTGLLTEVLMAQGYQDLTGQVLRRVIELVKEVEDSLVYMLTMFGNADSKDGEKPEEVLSTKVSKEDNIKAEGPILDADSRDDVASDQDDVDDLLSSLGF